MGNMLSSFFALSWAWLQRREKKSFRIGFGAKRGHKTGIFDPPKRLASTSSLYGAMHMSLSMIYSWEMLPLPLSRGLPSGSSDFPIWSYEYFDSVSTLRVGVNRKLRPKHQNRSFYDPGFLTFIAGETQSGTLYDLGVRAERKR